MPHHVVDLHCDLLSYLQRDRSHSPFDKVVRCAIPQLRAGGVQLQTMAIFSETKSDSEVEGQKQFKTFCHLPDQCPDTFKIVSSATQARDILQSPYIGIMVAIENASAFCGEDEPLEEGLKRLETMLQEVKRIFYVSLTWNTENRFGGGAHTEIGLKDDGRALLDFFAEKKIAVDLSHASDVLGHDIFAYIDEKKLPLSVLASHSNMRSITDNPRNLPDDIASEIFGRGGVIGLNFIKEFVGGNSVLHSVDHLKKLLDLGGKEYTCFGADFFCDSDMPNQAIPHEGSWFFSDCPNASSYPEVITIWKKQLGLSDEDIGKVSSQNLCHFLERVWK